jgi:GntR family transcriptional regulator
LGDRQDRGSLNEQAPDSLATGSIWTIMTAASNQAHGEGKRGCGAKRQPRYLEIRNALRDRITGGGYRIAEKLPSEHTLMERFAASRVTIRKALSGLLEDGLIVSRQGEGYFVTRPAVVQDLRRLQGLSERARELGHQVRSEVVSTREVDADKAVAEALSLRPGTRVFELKRVRYLNASPLSFDVSYFPLSLGRALLQCDLASIDVYVLLGQLLDLGHADFLIEVSKANDEVYRALGMAEGDAVLRVTRSAYMMSGKPVDFEYVYGRPDSYSFKVRVPRW